jgi:hypothetical protein
MTVCLFPDSIAQKAHYESQDPSRSNVIREIGITWTGDRDELSGRFQHPQRFFEHVLAQAIQDEVIIVQGFLEVVRGEKKDQRKDRKKLWAAASPTSLNGILLVQFYAGIDRSQAK